MSPRRKRRMGPDGGAGRRVRPSAEWRAAGAAVPLPPRMSALSARHVRELVGVLGDPAGDLTPAARWGAVLGVELGRGSRLLVGGNGGSAAEAQHLTAELVGRYCDERRPLSALALHAETSSVTAIGNDYGPDEVFARQVEAHGRPGDTVLLLSTSGNSANVLEAARRARSLGLRVWALTGRGPNGLADLADEALCVPSGSTSTVQEVHLIAVHVLCEALDAALGAYDGSIAGDRTDGTDGGDGTYGQDASDGEADVDADGTAPAAYGGGGGGSAGSVRPVDPLGTRPHRGVAR